MNPNSTFTMNGGTISGNSSGGNGGGVCLNGASAAFTMTAAGVGNTYIRDNSSTNNGGGVYVANAATFNMNVFGNTSSAALCIVGNKAANGGGVYNLGTFTMNTGGIYGTDIGGSNSGWPNTASANGGGVYNAGTFTMNGPLTPVGSNGNYIGYNSATNGGGVYMQSGTFNINNYNLIWQNTRGGGIYVAGGTLCMIAADTLPALYYNTGWGVNVASGGTFRLGSGDIYGTNNGSSANTLGALNVASGGIATYGTNAQATAGTGTNLPSQGTRIVVTNGVKSQ
jgi:hypothetical protein